MGLARCGSLCLAPGLVGPTGSRRAWSLQRDVAGAETSCHPARSAPAGGPEGRVRARRRRSGRSFQRVDLAS